jgi:hypothetical protein
MANRPRESGGIGCTFLLLPPLAGIITRSRTWFRRIAVVVIVLAIGAML